MATILGLDYGGKRVGIAISDEGGTIALPLTTYPAEPRTALLERIADLVADRDASTVVVGLPISLAGRETAQTEETRVFVIALQQFLAVPVVTTDERLTSVEATRAGANKATTDQAAAALLLQQYLDRLQQGGDA